MNPSEMFCPHPDCPLRGQRGHDNIQRHSQKEQRYCCLTCGHTFAATKGTPFYRLRHPEAMVILAVALLGHG